MTSSESSSTSPPLSLHPTRLDLRRPYLIFLRSTVLVTPSLYDPSLCARSSRPHFLGLPPNTRYHELRILRFDWCPKRSSLIPYPSATFRTPPGPNPSRPVGNVGLLKFIHGETEVLSGPNDPRPCSPDVLGRPMHGGGAGRLQELLGTGGGWTWSVVSAIPVNTANRGVSRPCPSGSGLKGERGCTFPQRSSSTCTPG